MKKQFLPSEVLREAVRRAGIREEFVPIVVSILCKCERREQVEETLAQLFKSRREWHY